MKSKWLAVLVAVPLVVAGLDWLGWTILSGQLRGDYAAWVRDAWAHGWVATADQEEMGGYPLSATLTLRGFSLRGGVVAVPGGLAWTADQLTLAIDWLHPWRLQVQPEGHETLRVANFQPVTFTADRIAASIPLGRVAEGVEREMDLEAGDVAGGLLGSGHPSDVRISTLMLRLRAKRGRTRTEAALRVRVRAIGLPDTRRWPLGDTISSLSADLGLSSPRLPPGATAPAAAASWRDGHGQLTLRALDLRWGPLVLGGEANLGLDDQLQPQGHGLLRAQGADAALDALSLSGAMPPGIAATAKAVLALMAQPAPGGGVELPVSVKHSTLAVGKIPIVKLRGIDWGRV